MKNYTSQQKYYKKSMTKIFLQILFIRSCYKDIISIKLKTTKEIAEMLFIEHSPLATPYPDACTAFYFILETKNNKKVFTMSEERLSGLLIISIENKRAQQLYLDEVIYKFDQFKARKINF